MVERFETKNEYGAGVVLSWASILEDNTREQAEMTSRSPVVVGHVALMPDAHLGRGATVGSVLQTKDTIIPAAVGVDIGCGMIAVRTDLERSAITEPMARRVLGKIRETVPSGFGQGHSGVIEEAIAFRQRRGFAPGMADDQALQQRALAQFGTLGDGNHFAEVAEDTDGRVWAIVHSGSRGVGNVLATRHTKAAQSECMLNGIAIEHPDLAYFVSSEAFNAYIEDMLWAQEYAYWQRDAMMSRVLAALASEATFSELERINCHHNYAEPLGDGIWLTRKGAIDAHVGHPGIIPGSMGDATYIVTGNGNAAAYHSSPHGAGRVLARGAAFRSLDVGEFTASMTGKVWQDRNAADLLDEAPGAYKPISQIMVDAVTLAEPTARLTQFINYKGIGQPRRRKSARLAVAVEDAGS